MKNKKINMKIEKALDYMQNDTLKAIEIFDQILEIEPENIEAINGKGSSLLNDLSLDEKNNILELLTNFKINVTGTKSFDNSQVTMGGIDVNEIDIERSKSALIKYEEALNYYDKAIQENPDLNNIVTLLKNEVIELIDEDIEDEFKNKNPDIKEIIEKGLEYKNSNKLWDALYCFENAINADKTCINYVKKLINEIKTILNHELMIKTPELGNSKTDQLKIQSLRLLLIEDNPEQSLKIINQILEKESDDVDSLNQKGCILTFFNEYKKAIECFDKCLEIDENYSYAIFNKAFLLRMTNKLEESLNYFDKLLKITNTPKIKAYQLEILDKLHNRQ